MSKIGGASVGSERLSLYASFSFRPAGRLPIGITPFRWVVEEVSEDVLEVPRERTVPQGLRSQRVLEARPSAGRRRPISWSQCRWLPGPHHVE